MAFGGDGPPAVAEAMSGGGNAMADCDALIEYEARSVPKALILRHLFEVFQNATLEVIDLLEAVRAKIC
jgi:hypothetical protein